MQGDAAKVAARTTTAVRKLLVAGIVQCMAVAPGAAEVRWHWQDRFTPVERQRLQSWVMQTVAGLERLVGPLPFDLHVTFHRRRDAGEPVPWANTVRSGRQGVHFHVDPGYPLRRFLEDWTAPHELSHLVLPYLGRRNAWFAEGFASFMQYRVMQAMGVIDAAEVRRRYRRHLEHARRDYPFADSPLAAAAPRLQAERKYPVMYWGGAVYFLRADAELRGRYGRDLFAVLADYLACCRRDRSDLPGLTRELDRLTGGDVFSRHLVPFMRDPGFPAYEDLLMPMARAGGARALTR